MGAMSRRKGQTGEREVAAIIADLTGYAASRRVRQHDGDSDILGVPGWSIEVKRVRKCDPADKQRFWQQAVLQAKKDGTVPCLWIREDRRSWRVLWPLASLLVQQEAVMWEGLDWTAETTPEAWACVVREIA